jgi:hypothetical protein
MRAFFAGTALVAALASTASAQITVSSSMGAPDPGPLAGQTNIVNFNNMLLPTGITATGGAFKTGSMSGAWAQPPQSFSGPHYYTTIAPYNPVSTVVIDFTQWLADLNISEVRSLSFYWGSIDSYNSVQLLGANGVALGNAISGSLFIPANGNQTAPASNRRVNFALGDAEAAAFRGIRFSSTQAAFEFDDIALDARASAVVPEPAAASLLALGLAMVGYARRRQRTV